MEKRFENKFIFTKGDNYQFKKLLFNGHFKKIYNNRTISSIYYDNFNLDNLYNNINGTNYRVKYRVRWYNEIKNSEVFFEKKIKIGLITQKEKISLGFFFNLDELKKYLSSKNFEKKICNICKDNLKEILIVRYKREYWGDFEKKLRLTYDTEIMAGKNTTNKYYSSFFEIDNNILELKYKPSDNLYIKNKIKECQFNLRNQKFSKYVRCFTLLSDLGFH